MSNPQTPATDAKHPPVSSTPPTAMATTKLQDFIFDYRDGLSSQEYRDMLEDCGRLYDLESNHNDFSRRLSHLPISPTLSSTPLQVSQHLQKIHLLNHHISEARRCAAGFRLFWKSCGRSSKPGRTNVSWDSKVEYEGRQDTLKSFFKLFIDEYKRHEKEANDLRHNVDPEIINQLQSLNSNLDFFRKHMLT